MIPLAVACADDDASKAARTRSDLVVGNCCFYPSILRRAGASFGTHVEPFDLHHIRHLAAHVAFDNSATIDVKHLLRHKSIATTQRNILRVKKTSGAVDALDAALADAGKIKSREDHACG